MLRVIDRIHRSIPACVKSTFLLTHPGWDLTRLAYQYQTPFLRQVIL